MLLINFYILNGVASVGGGGGCLPLATPAFSFFGGERGQPFVFFPFLGVGNFFYVGTERGAGTSCLDSLVSA